MNIHFDKDIKCLDFSEERILLGHSEAFLEWRQPSPALSETIQTLLSNGQTEEQLTDQWLKKKYNLSDLYYFLEKLKKKACLSFTLYHGTVPLCTLRPHAGCHFRFGNQVQLLKAVEEIASFQTSRFAFIRNRRGTLICETPLAAAFLEIRHPDASALLLTLAQPTTICELQAAFPHIPSPILKNFIALLYGSALLETNDPALTTWDFHDLLFHTRSRRGRHGDITATRFRFLGEIPPLPPLKPMPEETDWIPLFKPDLESIKKTDLPFAEVLETRRSIREQGENPISCSQLSEFLYRSARVKGERPAQHYEVTQRLYPGGGACYELEIYPLIHNCEGLEKGLYYYHPGRHSLTRLSEWSPSLEKLLNAANVSSAKKESSQILLLIGCRFQRVAWKYQSMAYATILKDTGVLMQTMYLVANAMGLAPCAIGAGDSDLFAKAARTNYYEETTVGEFLLGSRKANG